MNDETIIVPYATFYVLNGFKQGGIMYLALFNIYINDLSLSLNLVSIGGSFGNNLINHNVMLMIYALLTT